MPEAVVVAAAVAVGVAVGSGGGSCALRHDKRARPVSHHDVRMGGF
jgi:hypothetical protein